MWMPPFLSPPFSSRHDRYWSLLNIGLCDTPSRHCSCDFGHPFVVMQRLDYETEIDRVLHQINVSHQDVEVEYHFATVATLEDALTKGFVPGMAHHHRYHHRLRTKPLSSLLVNDIVCLHERIRVQSGVGFCTTVVTAALDSSRWKTLVAALISVGGCTAPSFPSPACIGCLCLRSCVLPTVVSPLCLPCWIFSQTE